MSIKLSDALLAMLSQAAQREDRCVTRRNGLRGATLASVEAKLLAGGLVKVIKAKPSTPIWRRDEAAGSAVALKLTAAGLKAIAIDEEADAAEVAAPSSGAAAHANAVKTAKQTPPSTDVSESADRSLRGRSDSQDLSEKDSGELSVDRLGHAPRPGSKLAEVVSLLSRADGATLSELVAATGWLAHTTRAALTGLRQRGYPIDLDRSNRERGSIYRTAPQAVRRGAPDAVAAVSAGVDA